LFDEPANLVDGHAALRVFARELERRRIHVDDLARRPEAVHELFDRRLERRPVAHPNRLRPRQRYHVLRVFARRCGKVAGTLAAKCCSTGEMMRWRQSLRSAERARYSHVAGQGHRIFGSHIVMPVSTLNDLFYDTLRDVYWAEKHLVK